MSIIRANPRNPRFIFSVIREGVLLGAVQQFRRQLAQDLGLVAEYLQGTNRLTGKLLEDLAGFFHSHQRRIGQLALLGIFAGGFAEFVTAGGNVQLSQPPVTGRPDCLW